ncbi:MAG: cytidine deaminase [Microthrixaceae bacterium]
MKGDQQLDAHEIDWQVLRTEARAMADRAYAPYSGVRVGAAALCDDGTVVAGCNVENASIGIGICAEVNLCGHLVAARSPDGTNAGAADNADVVGATQRGASTSPARPVALSVVAGDHRPIAPCGRCRQFLYEFAGPDLLIELDDRLVTLGELLPEAFGPKDVAARAV